MASSRSSKPQKSPSTGIRYRGIFGAHSVGAADDGSMGWMVCVLSLDTNVYDNYTTTSDWAINITITISIIIIIIGQGQPQPQNPPEHQQQASQLASNEGLYPVTTYSTLLPLFESLAARVTLSVVDTPHRTGLNCTGMLFLELPSFVEFIGCPSLQFIFELRAVGVGSGG